jgi:hypothetical protein
LKGGADNLLAPRQRGWKMGRGAGAQLGHALKRRRRGLSVAAPHSGRREGRGGGGVRPAVGPWRGGAGSSGAQQHLDRGSGAYDAWAPAQYLAVGLNPV